VITKEGHAATEWVRKGKPGGFSPRTSAVEDLLKTRSRGLRGEDGEGGKKNLGSPGGRWYRKLSYLSEGGEAIRKVRQGRCLYLENDARTKKELNRTRFTLQLLRTSGEMSEKDRD